MTETTATTATAKDTAVWLYAVTRGPVPDGLTELTGIGGTPVRAVTASGLTAVVSSVCLDEVGEQPLRQHLEDLDWLTATATAHDAVVSAVTRSAVAVPVRLATVYVTDDRVRDVLSEHRDAFESTVELLSGRTEWGVKAYAACASTAAPRDDATSGRGGAGTAYLLRRRAQLRARETAERLAADYADRVHAELGELAVATRQHPPQHSRLTGTRASMLLNAAYLVDDDSTEEFAAAVATLDNDCGYLHLQLTGPWPPYSFSRIAAVTS